MTLPNFIGLGVQKGGTSWLHRQLLHHPDVYVPETRKEIHFFDGYYQRGPAWYETWFPKNLAQKGYMLCGDITPEYLYFEDVAPRIRETVPNAKFLIILRHPVTRAYSHYQMLFQSGEGQKFKDFSAFMQEHPHGFKRGLYAEQIQRFFDLFDRNQFLILTYEETFFEPDGIEKSLGKLSGFLGINPLGFDEKVAKTRVGGGRPVPKYPALAKTAQIFRQKLRDWDMDNIAYAAKRIGLTRQLFGNAGAFPELSDDLKTRWLKEYSDDIHKLELLLDRSFSHWA